MIPCFRVRVVQQIDSLQHAVNHVALATCSEELLWVA